MRRRLLSTLPAAAVLLALAGPALAQSSAEVIHSYTVDIQILESGDLGITERSTTTSGRRPTTASSATIPTRMRFDDVSDRVFPIEDVSVESPDRPSDVEVSEDDGITTIKHRGSRRGRSPGRHTYTLTYRVEGAMNGFPDHDELFWNAIGDEWQAPIERAPGDA